MFILYFAYIILPSLLLVSVLGLAFYAWRRPHIRGAVELAHLLFVYTLTILFSLATSLTQNEALVEVWSNLRLLGNILAAILALRFVLHTTGRSHWITPLRTIFILFLPIVAHLLLWTNDLHQLFKRDWEIFTISGLTFERASVDVGYQLQVFSVLILGLLGIGLLLSDLASKNHLFRWKLTGLFLGSLSQLIVGIYVSFALRLLPFFPNLISLAFLPGAIFYGWALFRHHSYSGGITYHDILDNLYEALIVIDLTETIIQINAAAARWLKHPPKPLVGQQLWPQLVRTLPAETLQTMRAHLSEQQTVIQEVRTLQNEIFNLRLVPMYDQSNLIGYMLIGRDITTRKRLQDVQEEDRRALEIARNRYKELVDHVPGMVYEVILSQDEKKIYYNYVSNASLEIGGMTPEQVRQNPAQFVNRLVSADTVAFLEKMKESARQLTPFHTVARMQLGEQEKWHEFYSSPTRLADGSTMWHGIELDVTERYLTQEALQQNEEMLRSVIHSLDDLVFALDTEGKFVAHYQAADNRGLLVSPAGFIGHVYNEVLPPSLSQQLTAALEQAEITKRVQSFEYLLSVDTQPRWSRTKVSTRYDAQNRLTGYTVVVSDIQQQKQSLQQLADSEGKIRAVIDNSPVAMVVTDLEGNILLVNSQFTQLFGYTLADVPHVNDWFQQAYPNESQRQRARAQWGVRVKQMLAGETFQSDRSTELVISCKDESTRKVLITGEAAADQFIIILHDKTEQRRIEAELQAAKEAAEEASRAKSRFLASMSHELRTPLNAILGFTELLTLSNLNPVDQERVETIHGSGRHLLTLINDVLELSKIEAGQSTIHKSEFAIHQLLQETYQLFEIRAQDKQLTYTISIDPQLPRVVSGDELKTRQILLNLLSNAIKFTDQGSVGLAAVWHPEQHALKIMVRDTGMGIALAEQAQLFEPFTQTESGYRSQTGTGLGLALVREYTELLGGHITFTSTADQGSTFEVVLPLEVITAEHLSTPNQTRQIKRVAFADGTKPRILIVDDAQTNLLFVQAWLNQIDQVVAIAENGEDALAIAPAFEPDLIFMDLAMPVMDGYEATIALRQIGIQCPIVAFTANTFFGKDQLLAHGLDGYLLKPFNTQTLISCLQQHLPIMVEYAPSQIKSQLPTQIPAELQTLIKDLEQAVLQLDPQQTTQLIKQIELFDTSLAEQLYRLNDSYQLDRIAAWISTLSS